jgi:GTPase SAR1 family protein
VSSPEAKRPISDLPEIIRQAAQEGWTELAITSTSRVWSWLVSNGWRSERAFLFRESIRAEGARALAELSALRSLYLGDTFIGDEGARVLAQLAGLTELNLWGNGIGDEGAIALSQLTGVTWLDLGANRIGSAGARALAQLTGLTELGLWGNGIGDEGAIALSQLTSVTWLDLTGNGIGDEGAIALSQLSKLTSLDLAGNGIADAGAIALSQLGRLTSLDLGHNRIGDAGARALSQLGGLTSLDLRSNNIGEGARALLESAERNPAIRYLNLSKNCVAFLPKGVIEETGDIQAILAAYRRYRDSVNAPLNEAKLLVVGNEAVGKTSLIRFLVQGKPRDPDERKTPGIRTEQIETQGWSPAGTGPRLNVWDFGGQEILHQTHKFFLTERSIYLLVLEDRREDDRSVVPWLRTIANRGGDSPVLIVINKCDGGRANLRLDETQLLRDWPAVVGVFRTSCNDDPHARETIEALKSRLVALLNEHPKLKHVRDPICAAWRRVKTEVARLAGEKKVLSRQDFEQLCVAGPPSEAVTDLDEQRALLRLLHDLGVVVAHGFERRATVIEQSVTLLAPNWLTGAIYKILTSCVVARQGGVFSHAQLPELLDPSEYAGNRGDFVLEMMAKSEVGLCFRVPDANSGDERFLVPEALPVSEPYVGQWPKDLLRFRVAYEFLPPGLLPRFIVQAHQKLAAEGARWRTGVVLQVSECPVLVRANPDRKHIDIEIAGPPAMRRSALNIVREDLAHIHALNREAKPKELVPLPDDPNLDVPYEHLRRLEDQKGRDYSFLPQGCEREYKVHELLDGVREDRRAEHPEEMDRRSPAASATSASSQWILVLSDLHVEAGTDIDTMYQALIDDLRAGPGGNPELSALVVAGDLTNHATAEEFSQATKLILRLSTLRGISPSNIVVVPGNHDVDWSHPGVYRLHEGPRPAGISEYEFFPHPDHAVIRDPQKYQESYGNFSAHVYQKLYGRPYPLDPAQQVDTFDLEASGLCFVTFNSAWNTAKRSPEAATVLDGAVNEACRRLPVGDSRLKIAVWHHPITGNDKIKSDAFVERLRQAGVRLCLHGHIHESRSDLLDYLRPNKMLAVGTGSFGAPWKDRAESTPRLYQLLEIRPDRRSLRVYTRGLPKVGGAWGPAYEWPHPTDPAKRQPHYDFNF